jgi:hypothetical protein
MSNAASPIQSPRLPEIVIAADTAGAWNNVRTIAGVAIKELYRRKDFTFCSSSRP